MINTFKKPLFVLYVTLLLVLLISCGTQTQKPLTSTQTFALSCKKISDKPLLNPLDPNDIQLISWNIFKGSIKGWQADLHKLSNNQSIVLIQEAPLLALEKALTIPQEKNNYFWKFAPGYIAGDMLTGVMTFSFSQAKSFCYLQHKEPWLRSPKATLVTIYNIENSEKTLLVANVHGINFTLGTKAYRKQLEDLEVIIAAHTGPAIVAGDFNTWSRKRNQVIEGILGKLDFTKAELDPTHEKKFFDYPLDHIFYRGLKVNSTKVHQLETSDHNPIQVNFQL